MNKSIVLLGILIAAGAGTFYLISRSGGPTDSPGPTALNLGALKAEKEKVGATSPASVSDVERPSVSKTGPWPKVVAEQTSFSFGRMLTKDAKSHVFVIRNGGEADLILRTGATTCKCTQFDFDPDPNVAVESAVVKPGESINLTMAWKAGDFTDRGFRHGGNVYTNDPKRLEIKYTVEGAIETPFDLLPQEWNVGSVSSGQPGRFKAMLGSRIFEDFQIESIKTTSAKVTLTPVVMTPEEKGTNGHMSGYSLNVEIAADIQPGVFQDEVQIKLAEHSEPIKVTVTARKYGEIRLQQMAGSHYNADKASLQLGSFPASEGREAKMLLIVDEKDQKEPFGIIEVKADPSFITAELSPLGEPSGTVHRYVLSIKVPPGRPHSQRTETKPGFVKLQTNHTTGESINLKLLMYSN